MTTPGAVRIGSKAIGPGCPVFIVAEVSANHHHELDRARLLVRAARDAGSDAVKLQTYTPDTMTIASDRDCFKIHGTIWDGRLLHDLYRDAHTPWEWHAPLKTYAEELGMAFFSTPFDTSAVDYLEDLDVPAHKIASFELVDLPLLRRVGRTRKPVILSTGMATREEVREAVDTLRASGCEQLILLKCTSAYPATADEMDLRTIPDLASSFAALVGLSDHSLDTAVPVAAVALGACLIEKHITLSRSDPGPDSAFSLEPSEFRAMVDAVRTTERALGDVRYGASGREQRSLAFRRSLFVTEDVAAGDLFTAANVRCIRPSDGLHPRHLGEVIGRRASRSIQRGTPLTWDLVEPAS
jgi:pseudaminic acid synthase